MTVRIGETPLAHEYSRYIEEAVAGYKESVPRSALLAIGDEAVQRFAGRSDLALTELALCEEVDRLIIQRLRLPSFATWWEQYAVRAESVPTLLDANGEALHSGAAGYTPLLVHASDISEELIRALATRPELMHQLTPRKFEELVAELLCRRGFDVSLTPATGDGGVDIIAALTSSLGSFLFYVECKKYRPGRPVGVSIVRELFGVVQAGRATGGILVTSSSFTRGALQFSDQLPHQISLKGLLACRRLAAEQGTAIVPPTLRSNDTLKPSGSRVEASGFSPGG